MSLTQTGKHSKNNFSMANLNTTKNSLSQIFIDKVQKNQKKLSEKLIPLDINTHFDDLNVKIWKFYKNFRYKDNLCINANWINYKMKGKMIIKFIKKMRMKIVK